MERRLTCKYCKHSVYIPPSAQHIRCFGCRAVLSVGISSDSNDVVHHSRMPPCTSYTNVCHKAPSISIALDVVHYKRMPQSAQHINCLGCEIDYSVGNTSDSDMTQYRRTKYGGRWKKLPFSKEQQSQTGMPPRAISMTDQPRRGRRALLCGVSYKKQKYELKGTLQDVRNIRDLLVHGYNFPTESILILAAKYCCQLLTLKDDVVYSILAEEEPYNLPTRKNIEGAFQWLIRGIQPGDSLVFYFAGHGMQQPDFYGDEIDGFDETICPMDFKTNGMIMDDYINKAIVRPLTTHVTLHAIIDSCHSGTNLDLPCVHDVTTGKWEDNNPPSGAYKGTSGGMAICFSACEDYQLAADTSAFSMEKEMNGVMTIAFINAVKASLARNENITYQGIMDSMHQCIKQAGKSGGFFPGISRILHRRILQDPQLSSSKKFNTSTEFKL